MSSRYTSQDNILVSILSKTYYVGWRREGIQEWVGALYERR